MPGITIIGSGSHAPGEPVTNEHLQRVMDTSDDWIKQRTGIEQRHFAAEEEGVSDIAHLAAQRALDDAGLEAKDIDYIVFATMTPDYLFPGSGGLLGAKLEIPGVPALDIRQQCAAMPFGFQVVDGLIAAGIAETVLLVGGDVHAGFMPWADWDVLAGTSDAKPSASDYDKATRHRGLAVIFGDGAGAFVMRKHEKEGHGLIGTKVYTDGTLATQIYIPGGGFRKRPYSHPSVFEEETYIPKMEGRELFKHAVTKLPKVVREICAEHGFELDDVDLFIAHQANDRINGAVRQALKLPEEKVPSNIARYGNTSGGTIPILTDELRRAGRMKEGDLVCFLGLGSGLHWGAVLMRI